jgi:tRNA (mo5U34)-methyltransferase
MMQSDSSTTRLSEQEIRERMARVYWFHRYELVPGIMTPGHSEMPAGSFLDAQGISRDLRGRRALDIGTWDGPVAFELERRGADVIALDIQDPDHTGFNVAREVLRSRVDYVRASVYDLPRVSPGPFDIVCFCGVFYHLKSPLLAFEAVSQVMAADGQLVFEGECLRTYAETVEGRPLTGGLVKKIARSELPLMLACPGRYKGAPNWSIPNLACLRSWMQSAGLRIVRHGFYDDVRARPEPIQRVRGVAVRTSQPSSIEEHGLMPKKPVTPGGVASTAEGSPASYAAGRRRAPIWALLLAARGWLRSVAGALRGR